MITLSAVSMDHPLSCDYESLYFLWPRITLYFLTIDHPVFSDNRLPSCVQVSLPLRVMGVLITTLIERIKVNIWKIMHLVGWVGG